MYTRDINYTYMRQNLTLLLQKMQGMSYREIPHHFLYKLLNKRNELITKCRHENKFYLADYKDIPP